MSGLNSVMNSALKSMVATQTALSVASNNIANSQTPQYTRQRLALAPTGSDGDTLNIGRGVDIVGVEALRDQLVETRVRRENSANSAADTLASGLSNVELQFNDSDDAGLMAEITTFFNRFHTLSLDPASTNFREELKIAAQGLTDAFHSRHRELTSIASLADGAISTDVSRVNTLAGQIAAITKEIKLQEASVPAHDLRDRRSALVKELSAIVDVNQFESDGDYHLSTKGNHMLVLNGTAGAISEADVTTSIGNGSLKAHLDIRDQYIPGYVDALDQLAYEITEQVNAIHSAAYDQSGGTGTDFFTSLGSASGAAVLIDLSAAVSGDSRRIAASNGAGGTDNGAALALGNLLHANVFSGGSVTEQYRALVFQVGTDVSSAQASLEEHGAMLHQLENRRQSISGVSIDEETTMILQFQRAYEASARLIRTVDDLLQVVLNMAG